MSRPPAPQKRLPAVIQGVACRLNTLTYGAEGHSDGLMIHRQAFDAELRRIEAGTAECVATIDHDGPQFASTRDGSLSLRAGRDDLLFSAQPWDTPAGRKAVCLVLHDTLTQVSISRWDQKSGREVWKGLYNKPFDFARRCRLHEVSLVSKGAFETYATLYFLAPDMEVFSRIFAND